MKIWIRTQNRENLLLCDNFEVACVGVNKKYVIRTFSDSTYDNSGTIILGIYKDKTRALEVLDEIMKSIDVSPCYNMPEK